jgi:hypothetical protein
MNELTHAEMALETDRGPKHVRRRSPDAVGEGASFNEPVLPTHIVEEATFETFSGGAGI